MGIKTLQNTLNIAKNVRKTQSDFSIDNVLGLSNDILSLKNESTERARELSDMFAGITPEMREAAALTGRDVEQDIGSILSGSSTSRLKDVVKTDTLALSPKVNDMTLFSSLSSNDNQAIELLIAREHSLGDGEIAQPNGANINTATTDLFTSANYLPMPGTIEFSTDFTWTSDEVGAIGSVLIKKGLNVKTMDGVSKATEGFGGALADVAGEKALQNALSALSGGDGAYKALGQARGKVFNPRKAVLFDGIKHREFVVEWDLAPRNADQSIQIMGFIKLLHIHAAPELMDGDSYFKYPDLFTFAIKDITTGKKILDRGRVAVTNITCNYTPDGVWASFANGQPIHIKLSVSFTEFELPTKKNIVKFLSGIS